MEDRDRIEEDGAAPKLSLASAELATAESELAEAEKKLAEAESSLAALKLKRFSAWQHQSEDFKEKSAAVASAKEAVEAEKKKVLKKTHERLQGYTEHCLLVYQMWAASLESPDPYGLYTDTKKLQAVLKKEDVFWVSEKNLQVALKKQDELLASVEISLLALKEKYKDSTDTKKLNSLSEGQKKILIALEKLQNALEAKGGTLTTAEKLQLVLKTQDELLASIKYLKLSLEKQDKPSTLKTRDPYKVATKRKGFVDSLEKTLTYLKKQHIFLDSVKQLDIPITEAHPKKLEYITYNPKNFDPKKPTFYRDTATTGQFHIPSSFTDRIGRVFYKDKVTRSYPKQGAEDSIDIYIFTGKTGISSKIKEGAESPLGYVAYDRKTKEITVVFRGSKNGGDLSAVVRDALLYGAGNPDWVTDLQATTLKEFHEISAPSEIKKGEKPKPPGKLQPGFASAYLSARDEIVKILAEIRNSDPDAKQHLVTTGHSLGGALATMMFVDAKTGTLGEKLGEKLGKSTETIKRELLEEAECVPISAPGVCDNGLISKLSQEDIKRFHRLYFGNDPVVMAAGGLSKTYFIPTEKHHDISLGKFGGSRMDAAAHYLYNLHRELQLLRGIENPENYWLMVDDKLMVIDGGKKGQKLTEKQAAEVVLQFNTEYFLTTMLLMAELGTYKTKEDRQNTILLIGKIGTLFHDPYSDEAVYKEFVLKLEKIITDLESAKDGYDTKSEDISVPTSPRYPLQVAKDMGLTIEDTKRKLTALYEKLPAAKELLSVDTLQRYQTQADNLIASFNYLMSLNERSDDEAKKEAIKKAAKGLQEFQEFIATQQKRTSKPIKETDSKESSEVVATFLASIETLTGDCQEFVTEYEKLLTSKESSPEQERETFAKIAQNLKTSFDKFDSSVFKLLDPSYDPKTGKVFFAVGTTIQGELTQYFSNTVKPLIEPTIQSSIIRTLKQLLTACKATNYEELRIAKASTDFDKKAASAARSTTEQISQPKDDKEIDRPTIQNVSA